MAYDSTYVGGPIHFGSKGNARFWVYDTTDLVATVIASGYISDAVLRGFELGDFVLIRKFDSLTTKANPTISLHNVTALSASGATLSAAIGDTSGLTVPVTSTTGTPAVGDDVNDGYMLGSLWVETDQDDVYVCVDTTSGAAVWKPIVSQFTMTMDNIDLNTTGGQVGVSMVVPTDATLVSAYTVLDGSTTVNGQATITLARNATAITGGVITIAINSGDGEVDSCTPSALNVFSAGDVLNGTISSTNAVTIACNFVALFERRAV